MGKVKEALCDELNKPEYENWLDSLESMNEEDFIRVMGGEENGRQSTDTRQNLSNGSLQGK